MEDENGGTFCQVTIASVGYLALFSFVLLTMVVLAATSKGNVTPGDILGNPHPKSKGRLVPGYTSIISLTTSRFCGSKQPGRVFFCYLEKP